MSAPRCCEGHATRAPRPEDRQLPCGCVVDLRPSDRMPLASKWQVTAIDYSRGTVELYPVGAPWPMDHSLAVTLPAPPQALVGYEDAA